MRHLVLICLPAIFGMVYAGRLARSSSREQRLDYDPLVGPNNNPNGPAVIQDHGAIGDVVAAANIPDGGSSGQTVDYNLLEGPPKNPNGPLVNQQHGYNGPIQTVPVDGGSSQDNDEAGAGGALGNVPMIIPNHGGDSQDQDGNVQQAFGGQGGVATEHGGSSDSDGFGAAGAGGSPYGGNAAGGSNGNSVDVPKAAPAIGGGDINQQLLENQALTQSSMSGGAIAGVVIGVAGVAALGTAAAVMALRSGATIPFTRA